MRRRRDGARRGETKIESDDQVMLAYVAETAAQTFVTGRFRDAAALMGEHEIPHRPAKSGFAGSRFSGA